MRASGVKSGASSGTGEGTARVLAEHGASVVLGAHRTDKLMSIAREIVGRGGEPWRRFSWSIVRCSEMTNTNFSGKEGRGGVE
jgi:NAD(P)-dependent dehydrogenase (short-subunit alcohol dehydrogenase family)